MPEKPSVLRDTDDAARKLARETLRSARSATIAVIEPESGGFPFASRVLLGIDIDGTPLILVSGLSTHTRALVADCRCSLLAGEIGKGDPLAHARLTVQCEASKVERDGPSQSVIRARFLRRHPKAALYVDFPDFVFFRLSPLKASLNGGFGRAYALEGIDLMIRTPATDEVVNREMEIIEAIRNNVPQAADRLASLAGGADGTGWTIFGVDPAGVDLVSGDQIRRFELDKEVQSKDELVSLMVKLCR